MENASKALIIAGAILISILIISFGVIILGQGSDVINNANMSEAEIAAFNGKFEAYAGDNVKGSNVKQLIKTVAAHNRSQSSDDKKIFVSKCKDGNATEITTSDTIAEEPATSGKCVLRKDCTEGKYYKYVDSNTFYIVKCKYSDTGLIYAIAIAPK